MKKLLAILLSAVLVASMCCVFVSAEGEGEGDDAVLAPDYSSKVFWFTLFNDIWTEGGGYVITDANVYSGQILNWNINVSFAPVEGANNVFEVVATSAAMELGNSEDHTTGVPEGGFMYSVNLGNPPYESAASSAAFAQAQTWQVGEKYYFEGLDLENGTIPTTTPEVDFWTAEYVCTSTITPYVSYDETETIDEATGDYAYAVANGFTFALTGASTIAGEDAITVNSIDAWKAAGINWSVSAHFSANEDGTYSYEKTLAMPAGDANYDKNGNWALDADELDAAAAEFDFAEGDIILVAHSAYSNPSGTNYQAKIAALALKAGDKAVVTEEGLYVLMPGEVIDTEGDDGNGGDDEMTLEEAIQAAMGPVNEDAVFDVVLSGPDSYKAGDEIAIKATVKNIRNQYGLHMVDFVLAFDYTQLELLNEIDKDNILDCVTACPEMEDVEWENFSNVYTDEETGAIVIIVSLFTADIQAESAALEDGEIEFTFNFKALEDASEDVAAFIVHETVTGAYNTEEDTYEVMGNGSYVIVPVATDEDTGDDEGDDKPAAGDATNMIVFAVLALVAVAGSAVVIKSRR